MKTFETCGLSEVKILGLPDKTQKISVTDKTDEESDSGAVWIISSSVYAAGLTPDEADYFADQIKAAAKRVRDRIAAAPRQTTERPKS